MLAFAVLCAWALVAQAYPEPVPYQGHRHCACEVEDDHHDDQEQAQERFGEVEHHLMQLIAKVEHLSDEFDHMVHEREEARVKASNLKLRMAKQDHLGGCPKGQYRCASTNEQCVQDILVCDGHDDCDDGSDEDDHVCKNPFTTNRSWNASRVYDHCFPFKFDVMQFTMVHAERDPHFPSRIQLHDFNWQAVDLRDSSLTRVMTFRGYYYFSRHASWWYTVDDPETYWRCDFTDEQFSDMVCYTFRNTFTEPCAKYHFHEVDLDRSAIVHTLADLGIAFDFTNV